MSLISVDGIEYEVVEGENWITQTKTVEVSCQGELIATAHIDDNCEQIHIDYEDDTESASYSYWEYTTPEDLATWIAATSY